MIPLVRFVEMEREMVAVLDRERLLLAQAVSLGAALAMNEKVPPYAEKLARSAYPEIRTDREEDR